MSVDFPVPYVPVDQLESALTNQSMLTIKLDGKTISRKLSVVRIGSLKIRSGRLIVGDVGMAFTIDEPLARRVQPGQYDVLVSIWGLKGRGRSPTDGMGDVPRAAYLALRLSSEPPVKYEFAAATDQPNHWKPETGHDGFGVDVGGFGFLDADDVSAVRAANEASNGFMKFTDAATKEHPEWGGVAGMVRLPTKPPLAIPMAESGWGDGSYFAYWGLNAAGKPVVLIVDFDLGHKWEVY